MDLFQEKPLVLLKPADNYCWLFGAQSFPDRNKIDQKYEEIKMLNEKISLFGII